MLLRSYCELAMVKSLVDQPFRANCMAGAWENKELNVGRISQYAYKR